MNGLAGGLVLGVFREAKRFGGIDAPVSACGYVGRKRQPYLHAAASVIGQAQSAYSVKSRGAGLMFSMISGRSIANAIGRCRASLECEPWQV